MSDIQLYNNDCVTVLNELCNSNVIVDCIIADIPYNIGYDSWDNEFDLTSCLPLLKRLLKENGNIVIFNGWSNVCETKYLPLYIRIKDLYFCEISMLCTQL